MANLRMIVHSAVQELEAAVAENRNAKLAIGEMGRCEHTLKECLD